MTVRILTRVSTAEQVNGSSLEEQERVCRGVSMTLGDEKPVVYRDAGVSGYTPLGDRPAGKQLLEEAQPGDTVIAAKLDRMFRSASDALVCSEEFQKKGIKLILVNVGIDPVTENGMSKLFFTLLAAFAEFERNMIAERMAEGRRVKREEKGHPGGKYAPYGFAVEGRGRASRWVEDPHEMSVVEEVRAWHSIGESLGGISRRLMEDGKVSRSGRPFTREQIRRMLSEHEFGQSEMAWQAR